MGVGRVELEMTFIDIFIPFVIGILLIASPKIFTKASGEKFERTKKKLRNIGFVLIGVAAIYSVVKFGESFTQPNLSPEKTQMEMHRLQVQTPSGSDWYLAESTHGSFSVLIPIPFNDFTVTENDPHLGTIKTYTVGAKSAEGIKFSATETPIIPNRTPDRLDELPQKLASRCQKVSEIVEAAFSGWSSISFAVSGTETGAYLRYVKTQNSLFVVILEYPNTYRSEAAALKSRFLDSLQIKTPRQLIK
jgi:hypothetical protein